jgi:hypothetical protein
VVTAKNLLLLPLLLQAAFYGGSVVKLVHGGDFSSVKRVKHREIERGLV